MAGSPGTEEDSIYDTGRLSLFDLIMERTRAQNKVRSCCCIYDVPLKLLIDFSKTTPQAHIVLILIVLK